jgi:hypothetical protein
MRMKKLMLTCVLTLMAASCHHPVSPEVLYQWQSRPLYTCCNLHYGYYGPDKIDDANYDVGSMLPFGSAVTIESMTDDSVIFRSGATQLQLTHRAGHKQESAQQYFSKIFVETNPHITFASYPKLVQTTITEGRVERGMTKEQVVMSLGYPPTHRTASLDLNNWIYWYNRWTTYHVTFDAAGEVSLVRGANAPTDNRPIVYPTATPTETVLRPHQSRP